MVFLRQRSLWLLARSLHARVSLQIEEGSSARSSIILPISARSKQPTLHGSENSSISKSAFWEGLKGRRGFCGGSSSEDYSQELDEINLKFAEAREEIESAMESKETVYFNEEADCAREAVKDVLHLFDGLLERLPEKEKSAVRRSMGLKIEQLKAELAQLNE
ncbi:embryogenesis-like protein [Wolffia australiana]